MGPTTKRRTKEELAGGEGEQSTKLTYIVLTLPTNQRDSRTQEKTKKASTNWKQQKRRESLSTKKLNLQ